MYRDLSHIDAPVNVPLILGVSYDFKAWASGICGEFIANAVCSNLINSIR